MICAFTPLLAVVYVAFVAERLFEIALHRSHVAKLNARGARWLAKDGFGLILTSQWILFVGLLAEGFLSPWAGETPWTLPLVAVLVASQALRYWAIATLGERWAIRVVTVSDAPRVLGGPYRFLPHPNYLAVMIEAIALPLAFGAYATLAIVVPLQAIALWRRIGIEERALREAQGAWSTHRPS